MSGVLTETRLELHTQLAADAAGGRGLDLLVSGHRRTLARRRVTPDLVVGRLASEDATVGAEMAFEIALLHAAISTDSTRAHPVAGMESPRSRRSSSTSSIASRTMTRASSSPSPCVCTSGSSGTCAYTQPSPASSKTTLKVSTLTSRTVALLWT